MGVTIGTIGAFLQPLPCERQKNENTLVVLGVWNPSTGQSELSLAHLPVTCLLLELLGCLSQGPPKARPESPNRAAPKCFWPHLNVGQGGESAVSTTARQVYILTKQSYNPGPRIAIHCKSAGNRPTALDSSPPPWQLIGPTFLALRGHPQKD